MRRLVDGLAFLALAAATFSWALAAIHPGMAESNPEMG